MRHEEWHVTVAPDTDVVEWYLFCRAVGIKPLHIELNNFERQLMCAASFDPLTVILHAGFTVIRSKYEVSALLPGETAMYWECHVKLDGPFMPALAGSSRDLYRQERWYSTRRSYVRPFLSSDWVLATRNAVDNRNTIAGFEYEAAIFDSNPSLDARWL